MNKQDLEKRRIAYFTMEIGLDPKMSTYSGGLGVLAGDTIKSCADLGVPIIAVTLLNEKGYFAQRLDATAKPKGLLGKQMPRQSVYMRKAIVKTPNSIHS